jgi:hypothetical protein
LVEAVVAPLRLDDLGGGDEWSHGQKDRQAYIWGGSYDGKKRETRTGAP